MLVSSEQAGLCLAVLARDPQLHCRHAACRRGWCGLAAVGSILCILALCSAWSAHTQLLVGALPACMLPVCWEPCAALCHLTSTALLASYTLAPMQAGHHAR